jgi:hypothetical protein
MNRIDKVIKKYGRLDFRPVFKAVRNFKELLRVNAAFLRGEVNGTPYHLGPIADETGPIAKELIELHEKYGVMTINGQPGTCTYEEWIEPWTDEELKQSGGGVFLDMEQAPYLILVIEAKDEQKVAAALRSDPNSKIDFRITPADHTKYKGPPNTLTAPIVTRARTFKTKTPANERPEWKKQTTLPLGVEEWALNHTFRQYPNVWKFLKNCLVVRVSILEYCNSTNLGGWLADSLGKQ